MPASAKRRTQRSKDLGSSRPSLVRDRLTVREYAAALEIPYSTLRKQIERAFRSVDGFPYPRGAADPRTPWFQPIEEIFTIHGAHTRHFNFSAIDLTHYPAKTRTRIRYMLNEGSRGPKKVDPGLQSTRLREAARERFIRVMADPSSRGSSIDPKR